MLRLILMINIYQNQYDHFNQNDQYDHFKKTNEVWDLKIH